MRPNKNGRSAVSCALRADSPSYFGKSRALRRRWASTAGLARRPRRPASYIWNRQRRRCLTGRRLGAASSAGASDRLDRTRWPDASSRGTGFDGLQTGLLKRAVRHGRPHPDQPSSPGTGPQRPRGTMARRQSTRLGGAAPIPPARCRPANDNMSGRLAVTPVGGHKSFHLEGPGPALS